MSVDSAAVAAVTGFVRALPLQLFDAPDARSLALLRRHALFRRPVTLPSTQGASAVFLQAVSVSPVLISVTTHINARMALLDSLGGFLGTVDNAQLTLDRFAARNLLLSRPALGRALSVHYAKQALLQLYRVVGSISVLGNPVGLLQSVGSGMRDFFLEPFRGLGSGGEGFVTGVGRGALSLLQNASYGMLNSVGRIASSIGDGLCLMTLSDDFAANRSAGRNGLVYGVKEGVLGLFRDTVDGADLRNIWAGSDVMTEYAKLTDFLSGYDALTPGWATARTEWWNMLQRVGNGGDVVLETDTLVENANAAAKE